LLLRHVSPGFETLREENFGKLRSPDRLKSDGVSWLDMDIARTQRGTPSAEHCTRHGEVRATGGERRELWPLWS
jgi:hypothetical protein